MASSSDVSPTTSGKVALLRDLSVSGNLSSEENDSPLLLSEWEKSDGETEVDSATSSSVAGASEKLFSYTQSPETLTDHKSESAANYQSDSSIDSYFLVSADATCAAS